MVSTKVMDCLAKRDLLGREPVNRERLLEAGSAALEAGLVYDGIDLLGRGGEREKVLALADQAAGNGDLFLHLHALKTAGAKREKARLEDLARAAEARGWLAFAGRAREMAGSETDEDHGT
jgi:hypothetical protein